MKKQLFTAILIVSTVFIGCKKDEETTNGDISNITTSNNLTSAEIKTAINLATIALPINASDDSTEITLNSDSSYTKRFTRKSKRLNKEIWIININKNGSVTANISTVSFYRDLTMTGKIQKDGTINLSGNTLINGASLNIDLKPDNSFVMNGTESDGATINVIGKADGSEIATYKTKNGVSGNIETTSVDGVSIKEIINDEGVPYVRITSQPNGSEKVESI